MKVFLILFIISFNIVLANNIYRNDEGDFYAYLDNGEKVLFNPEGILINNNLISFGENYFAKYLGGQMSHKLNIYKDDIIKENIQVYSLIKYNNIEVKLNNNKLIIYDLDNKNIYLNNIKSDINQLNKYINFNHNTNNNHIQSDDLSLEYSTFINNQTFGRVNALCTDDYSNTYITGSVIGGMDPLLKGDYYFKNSGKEDVFIQKYDENNKLVWATYLGSEQDDVAFGIAIKNNNLYICGSTRGYSFQSAQRVLKRYQNGNADGFVSNLTIDGKLLKSYYNGSSGYDAFTHLAIDNDNVIWVIGRTFEPGAYVSADAINSSNSGYYDFLFMGIDKSNDQIFSTYLGSEESETGDALCLVGDDYIVLGGKINNFEESSEGGRGKLYLFNKKNKSIVWEKEIGNGAFTTVQNLESKNNNEFYISGYTTDNTLATDGAFQTELKGLGQYIAKYNLQGDKIALSYIDGSYDEGERTLNFVKGGLHYNEADDILAFGGFTLSDDLPTTTNAFQPKKMAGRDAFFGIINSNLRELNYLSYLGGSKIENIWDIYYENKSIYLAGQSNSTDFHLSPDFIYNKEFESSYPCGFYTKLTIPRVELPCENNIFDIKDFSKIKDFNLIQNAVVYDSILRLTKSDVYQKGAIWFNNTVDLSKGFNTKFTFRISEGKDLSEPDGSLPGADGITFLIQTNSPNIIGVAGGGLGYEGIENCLAIELDLYQNKDINYAAPNGNHIACFASKNQLIPNHNSTDLIAQNINLPIIKNDNTNYTLEIDFNIKSNNLIVYLNETNANQKERLNINNFKLNGLINLINNNSAFIGISAATGNSVQRQEILQWSFCGGQSTTGIKNNNANNIKEYNLFPNPSINKFYIDGITKLNTIKIIDYLGNEVEFNSELTNNKLEID